MVQEKEKNAIVSAILENYNKKIYTGKTYEIYSLFLKFLSEQEDVKDLFKGIDKNETLFSFLPTENKNDIEFYISCRTNAISLSDIQKKIFLNITYIFLEYEKISINNNFHFFFMNKMNEEEHKTFKDFVFKSLEEVVNLTKNSTPEIKELKEIFENVKKKVEFLTKENEAKILTFKKNYDRLLLLLNIHSKKSEDLWETIEQIHKSIDKLLELLEDKKNLQETFKSFDTLSNILDKCSDFIQDFVSTKSFIEKDKDGKLFISKEKFFTEYTNYLINKVSCLNISIKIENFYLSDKDVLDINKIIDDIKFLKNKELELLKTTTVENQINKRCLIFNSSLKKIPTSKFTYNQDQLETNIKNLDTLKEKILKINKCEEINTFLKLALEYIEIKKKDFLEKIKEINKSSFNEVKKKVNDLFNSYNVENYDHSKDYEHMFKNLTIAEKIIKDFSSELEKKKQESFQELKKIFEETIKDTEDFSEKTKKEIDNLKDSERYLSKIIEAEELNNIFYNAHHYHSAHHSNSISQNMSNIKLSLKNVTSEFPRKQKIIETLKKIEIRIKQQETEINVKKKDVEEMCKKINTFLSKCKEYQTVAEKLKELKSFEANIGSGIIDNNNNFYTAIKNLKKKLQELTIKELREINNLASKNNIEILNKKLTELELFKRNFLSFLQQEEIEQIEITINNLKEKIYKEKQLEGTSILLAYSLKINSFQALENQEDIQKLIGGIKDLEKTKLELELLDKTNFNENLIENLNKINVSINTIFRTLEIKINEEIIKNIENINLTLEKLKAVNVEEQKLNQIILDLESANLKIEIIKEYKNDKEIEEKQNTIKNLLMELKKKSLNITNKPNSLNTTNNLTKIFLVVLNLILLFSLITISFYKIKQKITNEEGFLILNQNLI